MSITLQLEGHTEKIAPADSYQETFAYPPLYHQIRTREALRRFDVVVNTYNTGTGKTRASLLHLFDLGEQQNVLFIAPTNALIDQHVDTIRAFVSEHNLDFHVTPVTADTVRALREVMQEIALLGLWRSRFFEKAAFTAEQLCGSCTGWTGFQKIWISRY